MRPIEFKGMTRILRRPASMSEEECNSLPVYSNGKFCVSCWRLGFLERLRALVFGRIWIWIHSGETQPPISLACYKSLFVSRRKSE